jgi:hypothetical protein
MPAEHPRNHSKCVTTLLKSLLLGFGNGWPLVDRGRQQDAPEAPSKRTRRGPSVTKREPLDHGADMRGGASAQ